LDNNLKDQIAESAARVLLHHGLQGWSIDRVAAEAGCAKGLVAYHHGSKRALLATVASNLRHARQAERFAALRESGAAALDGLWRVLADEVRSGRWAAAHALAVEPDIPTPPDDLPALAAFGSAIGTALEVPTLLPDEVRLASSAFDGFQSALHAGAPEEGVREAYHRLWLALLP